MDTVTPGNPSYNEKARLAKTMQTDGSTWGDAGAAAKLAHANDKMTLLRLPLGVDHELLRLPPLAEGEREEAEPAQRGRGRAATGRRYNFQTLRDDIYFLAKDGTVSGNRVAPARSACAVLVSSQNQNREWIYSQQQTIVLGRLRGHVVLDLRAPHRARAGDARLHGLPRLAGAATTTPGWPSCSCRAPAS